ncbi:DNA repair and recombination protein RadB [uncultured archaeon]|nr:DNA repair and recombination protein RadB [uncultured archaeon]
MFKHVPKLKSPLPDNSRVSTGVSGLDKIIQGGFLKGSCVLVTGGTGTGKTTLMLQFLNEGLKNGEKCIFITLEESAEDIKADALQFGWDFLKYEKNGQLRIEMYDPFELTDVNLRLKDLIITNNYKRVVIDSTSLFGMYIKDDYKIRKGLYSLVSTIKATNCTAMISSEITEDSKLLSRYGIEEFVTDGVIVLYFMGIGSQGFGSVQVRKMRRTNHAKAVYPMEITDNGIVVSELEKFKA